MEVDAAMKRPMVRIDLRGAMFDLRRSLETSLREQVSEHVLLDIHDRLYRPLRQALDPIHGAVDGALREAFGMPAAPDPFRSAIGRLRAMLEANAKERELQSVLVDSGLLNPAGTCRAVSEVAMSATDDDPRGMRMDLVVNSANDEPAQIIELKRGSHRLLVRRGTPAERISRPLANALRQLRSYGERLDSDADTRTHVETVHDLELEHLELRLVAGRRLPDSEGYHLLSQADPGDGLELSISTWDGFLAELERVGVG